MASPVSPLQRITWDQWNELASAATAKLSPAVPYEFAEAPGPSNNWFSTLPSGVNSHTPPLTPRDELIRMRDDLWNALKDTNPEALCCSGPWPIPWSAYSELISVPSGFGYGPTLALSELVKSIPASDLIHTWFDNTRSVRNLRMFTTSGGATLRIFGEVATADAVTVNPSDNGGTEWRWQLHVSNPSKLRLTLIISCDDSSTFTASPAPTTRDLSGGYLTATWTDVAFNADIDLHLTGTGIVTEGWPNMFGPALVWTEYVIGTNSDVGDGIASSAVYVIKESPEYAIANGDGARIARLVAMPYNDGYDPVNYPLVKPETQLVAVTWPVRALDYVRHRATLAPNLSLFTGLNHDAAEIGCAVLECSRQTILTQPKGSAAIPVQTADENQPRQPGPWLDVSNDFLWVNMVVLTRTRRYPDQHQHILAPAGSARTYPSIPVEIGCWRGASWHKLADMTLPSDKYWASGAITGGGWPLFDNLRLAFSASGCWMAAAAVQFIEIATQRNWDAGVHPSPLWVGFPSWPAARAGYTQGQPPAAIYNDTLNLLLAVP